MNKPILLCVFDYEETTLIKNKLQVSTPYDLVSGNRNKNPKGLMRGRLWESISVKIQQNVAHTSLRKPKKSVKTLTMPVYNWIGGRAGRSVCLMQCKGRSELGQVIALQRNKSVILANGTRKRK
ncbi:hypothetical protein PHYBLDRAFT_64143 [Phycomyces blakesleeanus NRRL 1555(-)]|uniref:Uncharacterized protein n=1 Tax=Phycomyces blakesleeanus (strain ATCC 8743b / DSM 1359 / FGSC 10004 / NBRC 33097 / NRRL 1555) TaxID=763407 RepID=A0A167LN70_PHYB8|nr:hypothetical protein PHYBLDRAFT_64143 [Phycomyces blakesleeanus NRRL 1555(-)]OAD70778.1 hypothetical protein PHYBLDRAFT_64143 [Phycomyces blakesleeanus NRRL 1555(-)]|eukprot:XP_018288818.1 hypothetical protein PHYBLDRAFT_64143 [Phycomyces blakesleeanus NRRL 1555(-)]